MNNSKETEIFYRTLFKDSFTEAPKNREDQNVKITKDSHNDLGYSHFGYVDVTCKNGKTQKDLVRCTAFRTFRTLFGHLGEPTLLWYTPNTLSTSKAYEVKKYFSVTENGGLEHIYKSEIDPEVLDHIKLHDSNSNPSEGYVYKSTGGRKEKYVRWLNTLVVDIDSKNINCDQLLHKIRVLGLPEPTVINETTNGYHVYWFLNRVEGYKPSVVRLYKNILKKIIATLSAASIDKVDKRTTDTCRYFQVPRKIIFSNYENRYSLGVFKNWLNSSYQFNKSFVKSYSDAKKATYTCSVSGEDALEKAINVILKGVKRHNRHDATFALSCYFKFKRYDKDQALKILLDWNKRNEDHDIDHGDDDVIKTLESVYSSHHKNGIIGIPTDLISDLSGIAVAHGFYKHRKERSERKRSHYKEWVQDVLVVLVGSKSKNLFGSQEKLAKHFGMCVSSFKVVLKKIKQGEFKFLCVTTGKGCCSETIISLNEILINKNRTPFYLEQVYETLQELDDCKLRISGDTIYVHADPPF